MVLKDEAYLLVSKGCQAVFLELEGVATVQGDRSRSWRFERSQYIEEGTLTTAGGSGYGNRFTRRHREIDTGQDRQGAARRGIFLGKIASFEQVGELPRARQCDPGWLEQFGRLQRHFAPSSPR